MKTIYLERTDRSVDAIVRRTFPEFSGRRVSACLSERVRFTGTQWSGGSRSDYRILDLATNRLVSIPEAPFLQRSALHDDDFDLPAGFVVAEYHRLGDRSSITLHVHPATFGRMLPNMEAPELAHDERIVLSATRGLKSSYGGQSNYRFIEAKRQTGITSERWESAKQSCIGKGLLDGRGAITVAGKNAIGSTDLYELRQPAQERIGVAC